MADINENGTAGAGTEEKKFTQADVDAIIEGRLAREKQKYADYEDLKEKQVSTRYWRIAQKRKLKRLQSRLQIFRNS